MVRENPSYFQDRGRMVAELKAIIFSILNAWMTAHHGFQFSSFLEFEGFHSSLLLCSWMFPLVYLLNSRLCTSALPSKIASLTKKELKVIN